MSYGSRIVILVALPDEVKSMCVSLAPITGTLVDLPSQINKLGVVAHLQIMSVVQSGLTCR